MFWKNWLNYTFFAVVIIVPSFFSLNIVQKKIPCNKIVFCTSTFMDCTSISLNGCLYFVQLVFYYRAFRFSQVSCVMIIIALDLRASMFIFILWGENYMQKYRVLIYIAKLSTFRKVISTYMLPLAVYFSTNFLEFPRTLGIVICIYVHVHIIK